MKKLLAALLTIVLSMSMCLPAFADVTDAGKPVTEAQDHEKEVKEYLNNLKPPKDLRIESICHKDNIYADLNYHFRLDGEMFELSREEDITDTLRYLIYTESIFWLDENFREYAQARQGVYSEEGLTNEANFLSFYEGMFPECIYESDLYFFYDDCVKFKDNYGYNNYGFDMTNHYINLQVRYKVLDTLTGDIYYSEYSDPVKFGKGVKVEEDKPIRSFKDRPLPISNVKKYALYYDTGETYPYFCFKFAGSKEAIKAESNNSGEVYLRIEAKDKEGKWQEVCVIPHEYINAKTFVTCYLPEIDPAFSSYDDENIKFRFRYEFYLNGDDPWNSQPYGFGAYSMITIK